MALPINGIAPIVPAALARPAATAQPSTGAAFAQIFQQSVDQVHSYQQQASQTVESFLSGETEDVHKVALATQQAELSFEMFLQVRNKVVQAYQEVMRMQI